MTSMRLPIPEDYEGPTEKCPECGGTGCCAGLEEDCSFCDGLGRVPSEPDFRTKREIENDKGDELFHERAEERGRR